MDASIEVIFAFITGIVVGAVGVVILSHRRESEQEHE